MRYCVLAPALLVFISLVAPCAVAQQPGPDFTTYWEILVGGRKRTEANSQEAADKAVADWKKLAPKSTVTAHGPFYRYSATAKNNPFKVERQVTFDAEGTEGGRFHSRSPSVPSNSSGLTIGRGFDIGTRLDKAVRAAADKGDKKALAAMEAAKKTVADMLRNAGLSEEQANAYAGAVGLHGAAARDYLRDNKDKLVDLTPEQQKKLFEAIIPSYATGAARIVKDYYGVDFDKLKPEIQTILVDLNYRGDLRLDAKGGKNSKKGPQHLKDAIVANDLDKLQAALADTAFWFPYKKQIKDKEGKVIREEVDYSRGRWSLPKDRFDRRVAYVKGALEQSKKKPVPAGTAQQPNPPSGPASTPPMAPAPPATSPFSVQPIWEMLTEPFKKMRPPSPATPPIASPRSGPLSLQSIWELFVGPPKKPTPPVQPPLK